MKKHCKSRSVNAIAQVKEPETGVVYCWICRKLGHLKRSCQKNSKYQYEQQTKDKSDYQGQQNKTREANTLNHVEANGESKLENDMPTLKIELAGNLNSCFIKINKQNLHALLDFAAELSLIHTKVYNSIREESKLKKPNAFLQSVKGDSVDVDGYASLKYEIGGEKQEHEFFVVPEMNRNIILGRDCLKQFGAHMYYNLAYIRIDKSYVKMEEDIHISSLARLTTHTVFRPQTGKFLPMHSQGKQAVIKF